MTMAGFTSSFANTFFKYPSSKQNVVLLLPLMKLSCLRQECLLVLGNLLVRKQFKNILLSQTCLLVYSLQGCVLFLVLPQLAHDWHPLSLYQWVVLSLLHYPLHQSLTLLLFYVVHTFPSSFHHSPSFSSGYVF